MNKNNFIKFLEIGRVDKGLFRIWIVFAVIFYSFCYYQLFTSTEFRNYKIAKNVGSCATSTLFSALDLPKETFVLVKVTDAGDGIRIVETNEYGKINFYTYGKTANVIVSGIDVFKNEKGCKSFINGPIKEFYVILFILTIFPISLILLWFVFKKIIVWVFRGFKK